MGDFGVGSRRPRAVSNHRPVGVVVAILLMAVGLVFAGCRQSPEYSHLAVYNQTTIPIVFSAARSQGRTEYYVLPCSSAQFILVPDERLGCRRPVEPADTRADQRRPVVITPGD